MPYTKESALWAPQSYLDASPKQLKEACNGCGTEGWKGDLVPETIWGLNINECCCIHDWMYNEGTTPKDKERADTTFLNNMLRLVNQSDWWILRLLRRRRALKYYEAVNQFGGPAFYG